MIVALRAFISVLFYRFIERQSHFFGRFLSRYAPSFALGQPSNGLFESAAACSGSMTGQPRESKYIDGGIWRRIWRKQYLIKGRQTLS
jgi:hypothetical protein